MNNIHFFKKRNQIKKVMKRFYGVCVCIKNTDFFRRGAHTKHLSKKRQKATLVVLVTLYILLELKPKFRVLNHLSSKKLWKQK